MFIVIMLNGDNICSNIPVQCWRITDCACIESEVADYFIIKPLLSFVVVGISEAFSRKKSQQQKAYETEMQNHIILPKLHPSVSQFSVYSKVWHHSLISLGFFCAAATLDNKFLWINSFWKQNTSVICSFLLTLSSASSNVIVELASIFNSAHKTEESRKSFVGKLNEFTFFAVEKVRISQQDDTAEEKKLCLTKRLTNSKCWTGA